jgi:hypothetical protein
MTKTPYIDLLLGNPQSVREGAMGLPSYGVSALMAYLNDFFHDPENSAGRFATPLPDDEEARIPSGKFLYINEQFSWDMDQVNTRGRIVVTGPDASTSPVGIARGMLNQNLLTGHRTNLSLSNHNYTVEAYAREGAAAQALAQLAFSSLHTFSANARARLGLVRIDSITLGRERSVFPPAGSSRQELTMCPVGVMLMITMKYDTFPDAPKLARLGLIVEDDKTKTVVDRIATGP